MNREQAVNYLRSSGFSEEQIATIEDAFKSTIMCKDCIHWDGTERDGLADCDEHMALRGAYDFCNLGERRVKDE